MKDLLTDNNVVIQLIVVLGGIITTWLTLRYKDRIAIKMRSKQSPDRIEFIYDGYEGLIRELKTQLDTALQANEEQHEQIVEMRNEINQLHRDLKKSKNINVNLSTRLSKYEPV